MPLVLKYQHKLVKLVRSCVMCATPAEAERHIAQEAASSVRAYRAFTSVPRRQRLLHLAVPDSDQHREKRRCRFSRPAALLNMTSTATTPMSPTTCKAV